MPYQKKDIQAFALKGHGRANMHCIFISFNKTGKELHPWLSAIVPKLTSIDEQIKSARAYGGGNTGRGGRPFYHLAFTHQGFSKLKELPLDFEKAFEEGMDAPSRRKILNDIPSDEWEVPFQQSIDALLVIADNSKRNLEIIQQQVAISLEGFGKIVHTEQGKVLRHLGRSVEHFGYIDGISQPIFTVEDELKEEALPVVLQEEVDGGHGSYLVFRKLAQHVGKFNRKIRVLAKKMNISEGLAGAQVIGRFKNGKLLTQSDRPWIREFDFGRQEMSSDRTGKRCPFHAHVRKVNPRSKEEPILIARRGMTYYEKERRQDLLDEPDEGVGILFMCFQKSIQEQFEFIQQRANNARFPKKGVGIDPIIGQNNNPDRAQNWNPTWNKSSKNPVVYDFQDVVTLKGGNYFYAPSISFLRTLADIPPVSTKAPIPTYANKTYWNLAGGTYNTTQFKSSTKVIV